MRIYIGNLSFKTTEDGLKQEFEAFGQVKSVAILKDKETGNSRGFGFVEMENDAEAQAAINGVNGKDLDGRTLKVNEARPQERDGGGGGGGGGRGRGGGGGYGSSY